MIKKILTILIFSLLPLTAFAYTGSWAFNSTSTPNYYPLSVFGIAPGVWADHFVATSSSATNRFAGNVVINGTTPAFNLDVQGTIGNSVDGMLGDNVWNIDTGGNEILQGKMTAQSIGNYGFYYDGSVSHGNIGDLLQSTGSATKWVATSSLRLTSILSGGSPNFLTYWVSTSTISATSSPVVGYITATSTIATSTFPIASTTSLYFGGLNSSFLSVNQQGQVIATTTPLLIEPFWNQSGSVTTNNVSEVDSSIGSFGVVNATSTSATSTFPIASSTSFYSSTLTVGTTTNTQTLTDIGSFSVASSTGTTNIFTVLPNGYVGIGQNIPANPLGITQAAAPTNASGAGVAASIVLKINGGAGGAGSTSGGNGAGIAETSGTGGAGTSAPGGAGGTITMSGGTGGASSGSTGGGGGAFSFSGGAGGSGLSTGGNGGAFSETGGSGGVPSAGNGGTGGGLTINAGSGGTLTSSTYNAGNGGIGTFSGGAGAGNGGSANGGNGGNGIFKGGSGGNSMSGTGGNGANVYVYGGLGGTGGTAGTAGNTILGCPSSGACVGMIGVGTTTPTALLTIGDDSGTVASSTILFGGDLQFQYSDPVAGVSCARMVNLVLVATAGACTQ